MTLEILVIFHIHLSFVYCRREVMHCLAVQLPVTEEEFDDMLQGFQLKLTEKM